MRVSKFRILFDSFFDTFFDENLVLERSWAVLGWSWAILGGLGAVLGRSWAILGRSWAVLGRSWGRIASFSGSVRSVSCCSGCLDCLGRLGLKFDRCRRSWACFRQLIRCSRSWARFVELIRRFPFPAAQVSSPWRPYGPTLWQDLVCTAPQCDKKCVNFAQGLGIS